MTAPAVAAIVWETPRDMPREAAASILDGRVKIALIERLQGLIGQPNSQSAQREADAIVSRFRDEVQTQIPSDMVFDEALAVTLEGHEVRIDTGHRDDQGVPCLITMRSSRPQ